MLSLVNGRRCPVRPQSLSSSNVLFPDERLLILVMLIEISRLATNSCDSHRIPTYNGGQHRLLTLNQDSNKIQYYSLLFEYDHRRLRFSLLLILKKNKYQFMNQGPYNRLFLPYKIPRLGPIVETITSTAFGTTTEASTVSKCHYISQIFQLSSDRKIISYCPVIFAICCYHTFYMIANGAHLPQYYGSRSTLPTSTKQLSLVPGF